MVDEELLQIAEKAYRDHIEHRAMQHAIEAYEAAKLAALPMESLQRVERALKPYINDGWRLQASRVALAAIPPEPVEADEEEVLVVFYNQYLAASGSHYSLQDAFRSLRNAGFRIVKGNAS